MPYRYLEDIATADVAFSASGNTLEEMFISAADALMNTMVNDLAAIRPETMIPVDLRHEEPDLLLYTFLNEFIYYKDARSLLLRVDKLDISFDDGGYHLTGQLTGEAINPLQHRLLVDIKAVTLHLLRAEKNDEGWEALVVVDV